MIDYMVVPVEERILHTADAIKARGIHVEIVQTGAEALERLQQLIPSGSKVMTGRSKTLQDIGFEDLLISKTHAWRNLKDDLLAETDAVNQMRLRRESGMAEYYLGSVQAIAETGEIVIASGTGSQLPAYAYSSPNLIWIAGVQKIVPTLEDAIRRIREYSVPMEDVAIKAMGYPGAVLGKMLIIEQEAAMNQRNITLILVNEPVGV